MQGAKTRPSCSEGLVCVVMGCHFPVILRQTREDFIFLKLGLLLNFLLPLDVAKGRAQTVHVGARALDRVLGERSRRRPRGYHPLP